MNSRELEGVGLKKTFYTIGVLVQQVSNRISGSSVSCAGAGGYRKQKHKHLVSACRNV